MRCKAPLLACAALACLAVLAGGSTAAATPGNSTTLSGANITSITIDPADPAQMFAGYKTNGGWQSEDGGASWSRSDVAQLAFDAVDPDVVYRVGGGTTGLTYIQRFAKGDRYPTAVTTIPNADGVFELDPSNTGRVYVATMYDGVFSSPNGTSNWTQDNAGLPALSQSLFLAQFAVSPNDGDDAILALSDGSVYRRGENGQWTPTGVFPSHAMGSLTISPADPGLAFATGPDGLYRSADGGATWTDTHIQLSAVNCDSASECQPLAIAPSDPQVMYASRSGGVERSIDGGQTFSGSFTVFQGETVQGLAVSPTDPSTVFAGTAAGVFLSTDGGQIWVPYNNGILTDAFVHALATDPDDPSTVYAGTDGGIWRSLDGGATWSYSETGLEWNTTRVLSVVISPFDSDTVYIQTSTGYYVSTDAGELWTQFYQYSNAWHPSPVAFDPFNSQRLIIPGGFGYQESLDGGRTFTYHVICCNTNAYDGNEYFSAIAVDPSDPSTMFAGGNDGVWRTTDGGATWTNVLPAGCSPACHDTRVLAVDPNQPSTVYWAIDGGALDVSNDDGVSWQQGPLQVTGFLNLDTSTTPSTAIAGNPIEMYRSTDGGQTWIPGDGGPTGAEAASLAGTTAVPHGNAPARQLYVGNSTVSRDTFVAQTPATGFGTPRPPTAIRHIGVSRNALGFTLTCADSWSAPCQGEFRLVHSGTLLASAAFSIPQGGSWHVNLHLPATAWKRLQNRRPLAGNAVVVTRGTDRTLITSVLHVTITRRR